MTQTLFHQDAYLKEFDAVVTDCVPDGAFYQIALNNTAFYYTSGGQPHDTGTLDHAKVLDVEKKNGVIWHKTDVPLEIGQRVHGKIDWARRFDHMCQHAADHMIAGILYKKYGATTIGLHTGQEISSIDVDMHEHEPRLTRAELDELELAVLDQIQRDLPIRCWFPKEEEFASLPLRKDPTVSENIRVVLIGEEECVACGGTHPNSAGQIGLVKILSVQPNRGKMRVFFVAGQRAYRHLQKISNACDIACERLSTNPDMLVQSIETVLSQRQNLQHTLSQLQMQNALSQADNILKNAVQIGSVRACSGQFEQLPEAALRELASGMIEENPDIALALFSCSDTKTLAVFACGKAVPCHMGTLLRETLSAFGGRGGGKPDFAMGSLPSGADPDALIRIYLEKLQNEMKE